MNEMHYVKLNEDALDQMMEIQEECWNREPGIFVRSSREAYARAFQFENFVVGALDGTQLAGFLNCARHNRRSEKNLGRALGYSPEMLDCVGHLNTVLMRPKYRGAGIARNLVRLAIAEFPPDARFLMATTSPENAAAQRILNEFGFARADGEIEIGGQRRLLFVLTRE